MDDLQILFYPGTFWSPVNLLVKITLVKNSAHHHAEDSERGCGTVSYVEKITAHRRCDRCAIEKIGENGRRNS